MRGRLFIGLSLCATLASSLWAADPPLIFVQGGAWNQLRADYYSQDQGSRLIPLAWLQALKQPNGQPFLADSLARYGYLRNPANSNGLPVGFNLSGPAGAQTVGMTCSACHTREITAQGNHYRIDGGPAIVDFQSFLADLDKAVGQVLATDASFQSFTAAVLGPSSPDAEDVASLRQQLDLWYQRYHTLITRALPAAPWGVARIDAVGMIFNRLTGLDLGPPPSFLIPENIKPADAPVRYPFLWNAPVQDQTQWPGFADNGNDILALGRNLGEVFGVFGVFQPKNDIFFINFLNNNSANFDGLDKLEHLVRQIPSPNWPWPVDQTLAAQGSAIFQRPKEQGGCAECHGITPGKVRLLDVQTWATPILNVGTDTREYDVLQWRAKTGVLQGAIIPGVGGPLQETDYAINILKISVVGSIAEHLASGAGGLALAPQIATAKGAPAQAAKGLPPNLRELRGVFNFPLPSTNGAATQGLQTNAAPSAPPSGLYESRVLQGIWAAAPYLHNGSVPTLAELLKPAAQRASEFKVGPAYDTANVGLAADQTQFNYTYKTTDCNDRNSGNSRCGHEYGTQLSDPEKKALLEYLKTL